MRNQDLTVSEFMRVTISKFYFLIVEGKTAKHLAIHIIIYMSISPVWMWVYICSMYN